MQCGKIDIMHCRQCNVYKLGVILCTVTSEWLLSNISNRNSMHCHSIYTKALLMQPHMFPRYVTSNTNVP